MKKLIKFEAIKACHNTLYLAIAIVISLILLIHMLYSFNYYHPSYVTKQQNNAKTQLQTNQNLSDEIKQAIRDYARKAYLGLKLRDLSRIDFFLSDHNEIIINEINTFPGMTPISMFPKLLEHNGHQMTEFLRQAIERAARKKK